jgi:hypothetical protein
MVIGQNVKLVVDGVECNGRVVDVTVNGEIQVAIKRPTANMLDNFGATHAPSLKDMLMGRAMPKMVWVTA